MAFTLRASTPAGTNTASSSTGAVASGANVTTGDLVVVVACLFNANPRTFVAADCVKSAGTSTIGTVALGKAQQVVGTDGSYSTVSFFCMVTGTGSLTMRVTGNAASDWFVCIAAFSSNVSPTSYSLESSNGASSSTSGSTPLSTGNGTSAGAAIFLTGCGMGNSGAGAITVSGYTSIATHTASDGAMTGGAMYHLVTSGTTEAASWATTIAGVWGAGASVGLAVIKEVVAAGVTYFPMTQPDLNMACRKVEMVGY